MNTPNDQYRFRRVILNKSQVNHKYMWFKHKKGPWSDVGDGCWLCLPAKYKRHELREKRLRIELIQIKKEYEGRQGSRVVDG